jgi:tetratricopeptide (TPR) repeat protein
MFAILFGNVMSGKTLKEHIIAMLMVLVAGTLMLCGSAAGQTGNVRLDSALASRDYKAATPMLEAAIQQDPTYFLNYYLLGKIFYDEGKWSKAEEQFQLCLAKKGKHYEALYYLARCQVNLGDLDVADRNIQEGLKKAQDFKAWFENAQGVLMLQRKQYQEADKAFRRALAGNAASEQRELKDLKTKKLTDEERAQLSIQIQSRYSQENAEYQINLGDANFYQGVPALAIQEYEKALQIDTASTEVYFHWAEACLELKDYPCALDKLRMVLVKDSTYADAWLRAGGIYFKAGLSSRTREDRKNRFMDAIGSYKRYLDLSGNKPDSSNVRAYFEMAMSYANLNGFEDAARYFQQVLDIPYEPRDIYFWYGKSLWGIKQYDRAYDMLLKHMQLVENQAVEYSSTASLGELYQMLGDCAYYRDSRDYWSAVRYYEKSLAINPDQKRIVKNVAMAYHSLKDYGQAIQYYDKRIAMGIDSSSADVFKNAGMCALNIASGSGAEDEENLDQANPGDSSMSSTSGIDPTKNYYEVAVDYMKNYLQYQPTDTVVASRIANTYLYQLTDCADGVSYFESLLAIDPNNCLAKKSIGYAYFGGVCTKDYTKAIKYLLDAEKCLSKSGGSCADIPLVKWIAQCYHLRAAQANSSEDYRQAYNWYDQLLKCDPSDSEARRLRDEIRYEFN